MARFTPQAIEWPGFGRRPIGPNRSACVPRHGEPSSARTAAPSPAGHLERRPGLWHPDR